MFGVCFMSSSSASCVSVFGIFNSSFLLIHQAAVLSVVLVATSLFSLKKLTNNVNEGERGSSRGILSGQLECCPSYLLTSFHLGIQYIHREQLMFYYLLFHISISIYFLAVQDSSIGDLVTHSLTH